VCRIGGLADTKSLPADQIGSQGPDIGVALAEQHGVPVYPSIRQTLCCGGEQLAVDGVLMIGEHGDCTRARNDRL